MRSAHLAASCGELLFGLYVDDDIAEAPGGTVTMIEPLRNIVSLWTTLSHYIESDNLKSHLFLPVQCVKTAKPRHP